jgi:tyrosyl-DNA phosphodiesterase 1
MASERPNKRPRPDDDSRPDPALVRMQRTVFLSSISRDVSPPRSSRGTPDTEIVSVQRMTAHVTAPENRQIVSEADRNGNPTQSKTQGLSQNRRSNVSTNRHMMLPPPFTLTKIRDLPASANVDTVSLHDILGNPLIKEAWVFNFCFDVDWMMQFFDPDVRSLVQVKIIHGSWRKEDGNRVGIEDACHRWRNVENFKAYLPDQFGTHHSKMFVLFNHDDTAEVVIHTANMLMKDWTNMTQAVWRSGQLKKVEGKQQGNIGPIGSGTRFKHDLLAYMETYRKPAQSLHKQLQEYDFSHVRGALVASVPSKLSNNEVASTKQQHLWGYPQLREVLSHVNKATQKSRQDSQAHPHLVAQVSSIATLPNKWLETFTRCTHPVSPSPPTLSIIYPTPSNVAQSLDGYAAGGSIHTKAQSAAHIAQISNLRPHLCQWTKGPVSSSRAGRELAAPHIKTYIQFNQLPTKEALERGDVEVDWALLTSANLSVQAWGSLPRQSGGDKGMVHIQSFEIGVLVWAELFVEESEGSADMQGDPKAESHEAMRGNSQAKGSRGARARMVPVFGRNKPSPSSSHTPFPISTSTSTSNHPTTSSSPTATTTETEAEPSESTETLTIPLHLPYDLPLTPYAPGELPWSPGGVYMDPDSRGGVWNGQAGR